MQSDRSTTSDIAIRLNINTDTVIEIPAPVTVHDEQTRLLPQAAETNSLSLDALRMRNSMLEQEARGNINFGLTFLCGSLLLGIGCLTFIPEEDSQNALIPIIAMAVIGAMSLIFGCVRAYQRRQNQATENAPAVPRI